MAYGPTDFVPMTGIEWGGADRTYGKVKYGDDSALVVMFYTKSVFNAVKSKEAGSRQYDNSTFVRIHAPAEKLNIIDRPVTEQDKHRFPHQWNLFLQNKTQVPEGTPIDLLFPNNPALADNLKAFGIYTVQQCANLSAHAMDTMGMGSQRWKDLANEYLKSASDGKSFLQMKDQLAQKDQEIAILNRTVLQLQNQYDDIMRRLRDPNAGSLSPGWVQGFDAQAERLNSNHPSQEMRPSPKRVVEPPQDELDQANMIQTVTEENFPTVDVTGDQVGEQEQVQEPVINTTRKKR